MSKAGLDDESAQSNTQFALMTVAHAYQSLLTVNTVKRATHNDIRNTLQLANSKHFSVIS